MAAAVMMVAFAISWLFFVFDSGCSDGGGGPGDGSGADSR